METNPLSPHAKRCKKAVVLDGRGNQKNDLGQGYIMKFHVPIKLQMLQFSPL